MKLLLVLLLAAAASANEQSKPLKGDERPQMTADKVTRDGGVVRCTGHVQAKIGPFVLYADQGTLHPETGEIDLRGHVYTILPARSDHHLFRYDSHALVTEDKVQLSADHLNLKNAFLQGSGHVHISTDKGQLMADSIAMLMNTADAEVRGNVQSMSPEYKRRGLPEFPPDIVK